MRYTEWVEKYSKELVCESVLMPHVEVPMSPAQYEELKITRPNAFCRTLYCEHRGTAYLLDPENEDDMRLLTDLERKARKAHGF